MSIYLPAHASKYAQSQLEEAAMTDNGAGADRIVSEVDREEPDAAKPPELANMLLEFLRRLIKPKNARQSAQRFIGLALHLMPDHLGISQMECAKQIGVTRASLSKTTILLAEELGLGHARWRKDESARIAYRSAQIRARLYGRHSSQIRRDRRSRRKKEASS